MRAVQTKLSHKYLVFHITWLDTFGKPSITSLFIMLICYHDSGHFGEARKNINYTQYIYTVCLTPLFSPIKSTSHLLAKHCFQSYKHCHPILISHLDPNAHITQEFLFVCFFRTLSLNHKTALKWKWKHLQDNVHAILEPLNKSYQSHPKRSHH